MNEEEFKAVFNMTSAIMEVAEKYKTPSACLFLGILFASVEDPNIISKVSKFALNELNAIRRIN